MSWEIREGDCLESLRAMPAGSVQCCVTSPPYWGLRDYGHGDQLGMEETPDLFVANMVKVFSEVRRVLRDDGTLWLNIGDSYAASTRSAGASMSSTLATKPTANKTAAQRAQGTWRTQLAGMKPKDLCGIPWLLAFALRADGWYLRSEIIWAKPNPMPESVTDRPTKAHEQVFLLTKSPRYFYDADAVREPIKPSSTHSGLNSDPATKKWGADANNSRNDNDWSGERFADYRGPNKRTVWKVPTQGFPGAHFATFPPKLIEPMILAGSKPGDTILDPFSGSGTTGMVALRHDRSYIGLELNPEYAELSRNRIRDDAPLLNTHLEEAA